MPKANKSSSAGKQAAISKFFKPVNNNKVPSSAVSSTGNGMNSKPTSLLLSQAGDKVRSRAIPKAYRLLIPLPGKTLGF